MNKVYLMKDGPTGWYKIGKSITPVKRERTLLAQQPMIDLLCYWEDEQDTRERFLHAEMKAYRRRGEWFELSKNELWRIYWMMRDYKRTDVHPDAHEYAKKYAANEWRFSALLGAQKRYDWMDFVTDTIVSGQPASEMEWYDDGKFIHRDAPAILFLSD